MLVGFCLRYCFVIFKFMVPYVSCSFVCVIFFQYMLTFFCHIMSYNSAEWRKTYCLCFICLYFWDICQFC